MNTTDIQCPECEEKLIIKKVKRIRGMKSKNMEIVCPECGDVLPQQIKIKDCDLRCSICRRLLAKGKPEGGAIEIKCPSCKELNRFETVV